MAFTFSIRGKASRGAVLPVVFFGLILVFWALISHLGQIDPFFLPGPLVVLGAFVRGVVSGEYLLHAAISAFRLIVGFITAGFLGTALALAFAVYPNVDGAMRPLNSFLRYIPATGYLGLVVLWFGVGELSKVGLVFLGLFFYIVHMTCDATSSVLGKYGDYCSVHGICGIRKAWHVALRGSMPGIADVMRVNFAAGWIYLIVAEYVAGAGGLGFLIARSQRYLKVDELYSLLLLLGILGLVSDFLFAKLKTQLSPWIEWSSNE